MLYFIKLGGSLITNKFKPHTARYHVINRLAIEIKRALQDIPELQLLIGHGSGSFGHIPGKEFNTREGVKTKEDWRGFIQVWKEAHALNEIVVNSLLSQQIPVIPFPPSAGIYTDKMKVISCNTDPMRKAMSEGIIPIVYGDVVFDKTMGGTILSTEEIFVHLNDIFRPQKILLAGIEEGVWEDYPQRHNMINKITPKSLKSQQGIINSSNAPDVTGGMATKVQLMTSLVENNPQLEIITFSGAKPNNLYEALIGKSIGTSITKN